MVVFGVIVVALGFFYYRVKREDRRQLEQQQQQIIPPPLSGNHGMAAANTDETPFMPNVIFSTQSPEDRTVPTDVSVDLPQSYGPPIAPTAAAIGKTDAIDAEMGLPEYKDQTQDATPRAGPSGIPPAGPIRHRQRNEDPPQQEIQEEILGNPEAQQRQQLLLQQQHLHDPPGTVNQQG